MNLPDKLAPYTSRNYHSFLLSRLATFKVSYSALLNHNNPHHAISHYVKRYSNPALLLLFLHLHCWLLIEEKKHPASHVSCMEGQRKSQIIFKVLSQDILETTSEKIITMLHYVLWATTPVSY